MLKKTIIILILSILVYGESNNMTNVILKIKTNKVIMEEGERIKLFYEIENKTEKDITIIIKLLENNIYWDFKGTNGKSLAFRSKSYRELDIIPKIEDLYVIKKSKSRVFEIEAHLDNGFLNLVNEGFYWGKYLYFPNSDQYILLKGNEKIRVSGVYTIIEEAISKEIKELSKNLITKKLKSKEIILQIK